MKFALALVVLCLPGLRPAAAQDVAVFGAQLCRTYLSDPDPAHIGISWVMGFWSGLNVEGSLKKEAYDIGHTLTGQQIGNLVLENCRQRPGDFVALAVPSAYTQARISQR